MRMELEGAVLRNERLGFLTLRCPFGVSMRFFSGPFSSCIVPTQLESLDGGSRFGAELGALRLDPRSMTVHTSWGCGACLDSSTTAFAYWQASRAIVMDRVRPVHLRSKLQFVLEAKIRSNRTRRLIPSDTIHSKPSTQQSLAVFANGCEALAAALDHLDVRKILTRQSGVRAFIAAESAHHVISSHTHDRSEHSNT